ncbi:IS5 family transposase [Streptomyces sp. NPDC048665]|uniref:IS5 family transposase n=1 Tax=Streptomyces sp. NPDC048665 TaxID=3155490 RepID=UPI003428723C
MRRGDLTNGQWARLESLLPSGKKLGRPRTWSDRKLIDGIRWRTRTGAPWRDLPECYGPWDRAYDLFRRWQRDGTWKRILEQVQVDADARGLITWDVSVDSTIARAHQHAAGARKRGICRRSHPRDRHRARRPRPRTLAGRADHEAAPGGRAGTETTVPARNRRPAARQPQIQGVLNGIRVPRIGPGRPRTRPDKVRADRAYGSRANRAYLRRRGVRCTIPEKADQVRNRQKLGSRGGRPPRSRPSTSGSDRHRHNRWLTDTECARVTG